MKFEFTSKKGNKIELEATVTERIVRLDVSESADFPHFKEPEIMRDCSMVLRVDGKKVDRSSTIDPEFNWKARVIDESMAKFWKVPAGDSYIEVGQKKILMDNETAERYNTWLADVLKAAETPETRAFRNEKEAESLRKKVAEAEKAEATGNIVATEAEAKARRKAIQEFYEEESMGSFEPNVFSAEGLAKMKARLTELEKELTA